MQILPCSIQQECVFVLNFPILWKNLAKYMYIVHSFVVLKPHAFKASAFLLPYKETDPDKTAFHLSILFISWNTILDISSSQIRLEINKLYSY